MRTTYRLERIQDNDGKPIEGCRDEVLSLEVTVDDEAGGAETLDELMDIFQRFVYAVGFTWVGDGKIVYLQPHQEVNPKGTADRLSMAERDLASFEENALYDDKYPEFPNGEFPNGREILPPDFLHGDYTLGN